MDPKTETMLHDRLFKYAIDKTLLVVTHRLYNIDRFDRVVVLENGCIVEEGPAS